MKTARPSKYKYVFIVFLFLLNSKLAFSQSIDTLQVCYYSQNPYSYSDNGVMKGIEVEILQEYLDWLSKKKNISVPVKYIPYTTFEDFYFSFKRVTGNRIGLGSVTVNPERTKDIDFTAPYLKDVAFLITNGNSPDIKTKTAAEVLRALGSMTAITMNNTSLNKYVLELKKDFALPELPVSFEKDEQKILDDISRNVLHFGYVNSVTFWYYLRKNPTRFLKMQKVLSKSSQQMGFILPKESIHKALFDEWFAGPNGFKKSQQYRGILEKYLGSYMAQNISVN